MVKAVKLMIQSERCHWRCWLGGGQQRLLFAAPCGNGGAVPVSGLNLLCLLSWKQLDVRHWLSSAGTGVRPSRNSVQGVHVLASDVSFCLPQYWNYIPTFCVCASVYQCFSSCNHHHISCSESLPLFFPLNLIKAILQITEANRPIIRAAGVQEPYKCGRTSSLNCKILWWRKSASVGLVIWKDHRSRVFPAVRSTAQSFWEDHEVFQTSIDIWLNSVAKTQNIFVLLFNVICLLLTVFFTKSLGGFLLFFF